MNVTEAKRRAKSQMRYGYFDGDGGVWTTCPDCRAKLRVPYFMGRADLPALQARLVEHLADDCERVS